jgi:hypothetical protein
LFCIWIPIIFLCFPFSIFFQSCISKGVLRHKGGKKRGGPHVFFSKKLYRLVHFIRIYRIQSFVPKSPIL